MNIFLWVLQILMALHTAMGAVWKFSNGAGQTMPSLQSIPNEIWLAMSIVEILCSLGLIFPAFNKRLAKLIPLSAACIAAEMILFSGLHLYSGAADYAPLVYWLVVAAICAFIAYGRLVLKPLNS